MYETDAPERQGGVLAEAKERCSARPAAKAKAKEEPRLERGD